MKNCPVYTIGYGNRNFEQFAKLLSQNQIKYLVDVRSKPYSRFHTDFNKEFLSARLNKLEIKYVFMGDLLGGQPQDNSCYTNERIDYEKMKMQSYFKKGIERLKLAWGKSLPVVLMCSESKPQACHRTKLIGQELIKIGIDVMHIDEEGKLITQKEVIIRLTGGQGTMFVDPIELSISKRKFK